MKYSFFTKEKLGPKQSLTPEGFLLCEEVPIARSGVMIYGPDETPIEPGPDGIVRIYREPEDVFTAETIASAMGKSVTNNHPSDDVVPVTWKDLTCGIMMNPRRGVGAQDHLMFADLLITTPEGIREIREKGKTEVSLGYDAEYEEIAPGVGKQSNLIINHIALVDQGRCGATCSIGDSQPQKEIEMVAKVADKKSKIAEFLTRAFKAKDAAEVESLAAAMDSEFGPESSNVHIHLNTHDKKGKDEDPDEEEITTQDDFDPSAFKAHVDQNAKEHEEMMSRITALEAALKGKTGDAADPETEEETEEEKKAKAEDEKLEEEMKDELPEELKEQVAKAKDSAFFQDSFKDTVSLAEILVPGIRIPVFDAAAKKADTYKAICNFRRQVMDLAYVQPATATIINDLLGGKTFDTKNMTCDAIRSLFRAAAAAKRTANNAAAAVKQTQDTNKNTKAPVTSIAELNKRNQEKYKDL